MGNPDRYLYSVLQRTIYSVSLHVRNRYTKFSISSPEETLSCAFFRYRGGARGAARGGEGGPAARAVAAVEDAVAAARRHERPLRWEALRMRRKGVGVGGATLGTGAAVDVAGYLKCYVWWCRPAIRSLRGT